MLLSLRSIIVFVFYLQSVEPAISISAKCSVRVELIRAVHIIVFGNYTSREQEKEYLEPNENTTIDQHIELLEHPQNEHGMYSNLSSENLLMLTNCLLNVHNHTKQYDIAVLQNYSQSTSGQ